MSLSQILALLLALSVAGNAWLTHSYLDVRDARTEATGGRDQARSAATACSDATEALGEQAKRQAEAHRQAIAAAGAAALERERRAQQQLSAVATRPGDDCGSARDRIDAWLQGRGVQP